MNDAAISSRPVTIYLGRKTVQSGRWDAIEWSVAAVDEAPTPSTVANYDEVREYKMPLNLFEDEIRYYRFNLDSEIPQLYLVTNTDDVDGAVSPLVITANPDESASYMETDEQIFPIPMSDAIREWISRFVMLRRGTPMACVNDAIEEGCSS